jgi:hypothetical protein
MSVPKGIEQSVQASHIKSPGIRAGGFLVTSEVHSSPNDFQESSYLPSKWAQLVDPSKEKIPTPLNEHGVVDIDATVSAVMATIHSDYTWSRHSINPHHFQWRADAYSRESQGVLNVQPAQFRNISPLKGHLPRELENWLHKVTEEPPVPSLEVMYFYTEAWQVAKGLYACTSGSVIKQRQARRRAELLADKDTILPEFRCEDTYGEQYFKDACRRHSRAYEFYLKRLELIPEEFRLVTPEMSPQRISKKVGRMATRGSQLLVRSANRAAA